MKITRIYTGKDNESHFEDVVIPLIDKGDIGKLSQMVHANGIIFRETPPEYNFGWHNAPQRQYVVMLEGSVEIEV